MNGLTITIRPKPGKPGWFEARAESTVRGASGTLTITANTEVMALRGALDAVSKAVSDPLEEALVMASYAGHA